MNHLLILVTITSLQGASVEILSFHDKMSACHVALTEERFVREVPNNQELFCIKTEKKL
jgi:hypothetical protein